MNDINLEVLDNCPGGCDDNTTSSTSNMERRMSPGFEVDPLTGERLYYPLDLLRSDVVDLDIKYTYLSNIFSGNTSYYKTDLQKRKPISKSSVDATTGIPKEANNLGDKYTEEDLKDLNREFVTKNNVGTNIVSMTYTKVDENTLEINPLHYRIMPQKRVVSDSDLCSQIDCSFTFFVEDEVAPPETIYPPGTFFRIAYDTQAQSLSKTPCEQQIYFVKSGNCVCPIPNKQTLQVMLVERNKVIQSVFVIEPSQFEPFEVIEPCPDRTSEWIEDYEVSSGCKAPTLDVDLSALDRINIPELPEVIQGPPGTPGAPGAPGVPGSAGAAGPPGAAGPAGAVGSPGAAGPAGQSGPEGPQGPQGPQGPAGGGGGDSGGDGGSGVDSGDGGTGIASSFGECKQYNIQSRPPNLTKPAPGKILIIDSSTKEAGLYTIPPTGGFSDRVSSAIKPIFINRSNRQELIDVMSRLIDENPSSNNSEILNSLFTNKLYVPARSPIVELFGDCGSSQPIDVIPTDNFTVSISHNIPNRVFNISFASGESYGIGFNNPYEETGEQNVFVPEFEYSLGDVVTMQNDRGDDEEYVLTDVRESSPTGDVRLSNIGQRTSDFQSVGRSVASNIKYVFTFTKVEGDLTDEEPIDSDLTSGDNGNTSNVRGGGGGVPVGFNGGGGVPVGFNGGGGIPTGGGGNNGFRIR
jgi:hypothetical protein